MKPLYLLTAEPLSGPLQPDASALQSALQSDPLTTVQFAPGGTPPKEYIRHILLGSPSVIRHTIHLLHRLHYAEPTLWTPVLTLDEPLTLPPAQGEAISHATQAPIELRKSTVEREVLAALPVG